MGYVRRNTTTSYDVFAVGGRHVETAKTIHDSDRSTTTRGKGGSVMPVEFTPEYRWRCNAKGNHIMMEGNTHRATVFRAGSRWRIIVNGFGVSRIAADEFFDDVSEAKRRTEMIAAGEVDDARMVMIPQRY